LYQIGVLALQGDFAKHIQVIDRFGHHAVEVRTKENLESADALILPGGESTTVLKLLHDSNLYGHIRNFAEKHAVMGTCAGLIMLAKEVTELPYPPLNLIDIAVKRNAYGRQRESFVDNIRVNLNGTEKAIQGVFIRAPQITHYGPDVHILGEYSGKPVIVANKGVLACTFHPELTDDISIHKYFINSFLKKK
jgi:5'-phosphate synthase pdxT subunit